MLKHFIFINSSSCISINMKLLPCPEFIFRSYKGIAAKTISRFLCHLDQATCIYYCGVAQVIAIMQYSSKV
jgi:hypothetical protein